MRKFRDLGALGVDLLCFCCRHLGLECCCRRWFFATRDRSPPAWACIRWSALTPQRAFCTDGFPGTINVSQYTTAAIQPRLTSEDLSGGTGEAVPFCIIGKRAG